MADLDDFFAKRDKKKPKGKKFATAEDVTKLLENKTKERKKLDSKSSYVAPPTESGEPAPALSEFRQQVENEDEEWKEIEEVQPDYTGLKIQELVLSDDDDDFGIKDSELRDEAQEEGKNGPWNKSRAKDEPTPEAPAEDKKETVETPTTEGSETKIATETESQQPEPKSETSEPPKTGGYIPPARRAQMTGEGGKSSTAGTGTPSSEPAKYVPPYRLRQSGPSSTSKKKAELNFESEESFPSLGS